MMMITKIIMMMMMATMAAMADGGRVTLLVMNYTLRDSQSCRPRVLPSLSSNLNQLCVAKDNAQKVREHWFQSTFTRFQVGHSKNHFCRTLSACLGSRGQGAYRPGSQGLGKGVFSELQTDSDSHLGISIHKCDYSNRLVYFFFNF